MSKKPMWYNKFPIPELPNCDIIHQYGFYVPNHQDLKEEEIIKICNIINNG